MLDAFIASAKLRPEPGRILACLLYVVILTSLLMHSQAVVKELIAFKQGLKASERPDLASRAASSLQLLTSIEAQPAVHLQG